MTNLKSECLQFFAAEGNVIDVPKYSHEQLGTKMLMFNI